MKHCVVFLGLIVFTVPSSAMSKCQQGINCKLPNCFCESNRIEMAKANIPQIIYFGFDDALNGEMAKHYRQLFSSDRLNPNGCPISMSLFVQHQYTDYRLVKEFYSKGMEIGVHSVTHTNIDTADKLRSEAYQQRKNLADFGGVPLEDIIGWRSPNLKTAGDVQPDILKELGYKYDISLTYPRSKLGTERPWPYTLDYGYPFECMVTPCPDSVKPHAGFWEVPVNALVDYKNDYPCPYVDGCYNRPDTEEQAYKYLWQNFLDYYEGSRSPLGFNMHAAWFFVPHNLKAMDRFIKKILTFKDVYIVTVKQMLDWIQKPTPLSQIHHMASWNCRSNPRQIPKTFPKSAATRKTTTTRTATAKVSPTIKPPSTSKAMKTRKHVSLNAVPSTSFRSSLSCIQGNTCKLPNCTCRTTGIPMGITKEQTPQMVYFTFDGPVGLNTYLNLIRLFNSDKKNPNNCSISATMFVSRSGNVLPYLQHLSNMGLEVGLMGDDMNTYSRSLSLGNDLNNEINYLKAKLPMNNFKGWRSPALKPLGDDQYMILKSQDFLYDSTITLPIQTPRKAVPWPYTLDYMWQDRCDAGGCPKERYPGLWEVPVAPILDYRYQYTCSYADGCMLNPPTADETFIFLWNNFREHYTGNKSPFGIAFSQLWFSHPFYRPNLEGLERFITRLLTIPDVYIVSIEHMIQWMRNPTALADLNDFVPWKC